MSPQPKSLYKRRLGFLVLRLVILAVLMPLASMGGMLIVDLESFVDGDLLNSQLPGLTIVNTIVLTSAISLNETDFPPHSGGNVASDFGGPVAIFFDSPITSFAAYFTYLTPLVLTAYDSSSAIVGSASSGFSTNIGTGGDSGSTPNELIEVAFAGGISAVTIAGNSNGGSFVMDDLTLTAADTDVPEPRTLFLWFSAIGVTALRRPRRAGR